MNCTTLTSLLRRSFNFTASDGHMYSCMFVKYILLFTGLKRSVIQAPFSPQVNLLQLHVGKWLSFGDERIWVGSGWKLESTEKELDQRKHSQLLCGKGGGPIAQIKPSSTCTLPAPLSQGKWIKIIYRPRRQIALNGTLGQSTARTVGCGSMRACGRFSATACASRKGSG